MTVIEQPIAPAAKDGEMRTKVVRGLGWKAGSQTLLQLSRFGVALTLARLLTPHEYGLAGMVLVLSAFVIPFADIGFGAALVQRRSLTEEDKCTAFWTSLAGGVFFTGLAVVCSPLVARFYGQPGVRPLFAALSLTFVITSLSATHRSLLVRELDFKSLELRLIAGTVVGAGVAVALAAAGFGPWALIGQELGVASVSTGALWVLSPWRPRFRFSLESLRRLGRFGSNVIGARFFVDLNQNVDNLLVGRFVGPAALGAYALAFNTMLVPVTRVVSPLQEVLYPAFSRLQDDRARMAESWLRVVRVIALVTMPLLLGLMVLAPDAVPVVFGRKWIAAVPVLQALAWVGILQGLQGLNPSVLQARNRASTQFRFAMVNFGVCLGAFVLGLHWGIVGVAVLYAFATTLTMPTYTWLTARALEIPTARVVGNLAGVGQASVAMTGAVWLTRRALLAEGVGLDLRLTACILVGAVLFAGLCLWRAPDVVSDLRTTIAGRRPATQSA